MALAGGIEYAKANVTRAKRLMPRTATRDNGDFVLRFFLRVKKFGLACRLTKALCAAARPERLSINKFSILLTNFFIINGLLTANHTPHLPLLGSSLRQGLNGQWRARQSPPHGLWWRLNRAYIPGLGRPHF